MKAFKTLKELKNTSQNVVKLQKNYLKVHNIYALLPSQQKKPLKEMLNRFKINSKKPEQCKWHHSGVFVDKFEYTLSFFMTFVDFDHIFVCWVFIFVSQRKWNLVKKTGFEAPK